MSNRPLPAYHVIVTDEASELLESITARDRRIATQLADLMEDLAILPQQKGSPLRGELAGLMSRHCLGNRFRIIYSVNEAAHSVTIVSLGIRKEGDKYALVR